MKSRRVHMSFHTSYRHAAFASRSRGHDLGSQKTTVSCEIFWSFFESWFDFFIDFLPFPEGHLAFSSLQLHKTVPPNLASFPLMIGGIFYIFDGESWTHSLHLWFHCICSAAYLAVGSLASQLLHLAICISRSSHVAHFFGNFACFVCPLRDFWLFLDILV